MFDDSLTDEQIEIVRIIAMIISSVSIFGTLVVFALYWFYKEIRQIALELVLWLCISVFFYNLSTFIPYSRKEEENKIWCALQAYMINSFHISSLVWCGVIGYTAYIGVSTPEKLESNVKVYRCVFVIIALIIPLLISLPIVFTDSYGPAGSWCWIKLNTNENKNLVLFIVYYTIAWSMILTNCFFFFKVIIKIKRELSSESDAELVERFSSKLKWYPIVQVICFIPGTINRIFDFTTNSDSFTLTIMQTIFDYSSGLLFAIVYGLNPSLKRTIWNLLRRVFCCYKKRVSKFSEELNVSRDKDSDRSNKSTNSKNRTFISIVSESRLEFANSG